MQDGGKRGNNWSSSNKFQEQMVTYDDRNWAYRSGVNKITAFTHFLKHSVLYEYREGDGQSTSN